MALQLRFGKFRGVCLLLAGSAFRVTTAATPPVINIKTQSPVAIPQGFSGFNAPQPRNGVEYYDSKFVSAVAPLKPGWLRFPAGTASIAFDWNTGHVNPAWLDTLVPTGCSPTECPPPLVTVQTTSILNTSMALTQAKGGVFLSDFAAFANALRDPPDGLAYVPSAIICINGFTDHNPGSTTQLAQAAQNYGLKVIDWELANEPYLYYPQIFPTPGSYAAEMYSPYYQDLIAGAPGATVSLFNAGPFTGNTSVDYQNWDIQQERSHEFMSSAPFPIRVLVVDDHQLIRMGIATLLLTESDITVVAEAANGREAISKFRECRPDVTLMDLQMPEMNGFDAIVAIRHEFPEARIVVLTTYAGDVQAQRALQAGAQAYLLKTLLRKDLLQTIRTVQAGRKAITADVAVELAEHTGEAALTPKEIGVLRLIAAGNANKEIAAQLSLTEDTIKSHVRSILQKLGANDRTHAVAIALKRGAIDL